jgi:hypothetical protein
MLKKYKYLLLLLALARPALAGVNVACLGKLFTASGVTGTAATENSFAGMSVVRDSLPNESAVQSLGPNGAYPSAVFPAGTLPAYGLTDAGAQWNTGLATGQVVLGVYETAPGVNGWAGSAAYAAAIAQTVAGSDLPRSSVVLPGVSLGAIPTPGLVSSTNGQITVQVGTFADGGGRLKSLALYRRLDPSGAWSWLTDLTSTAGVQTYTDSSVVAGTNYDYGVAINFSWPGGSGAGARPAVLNLYTTNAKAIAGPFAASAAFTPTPTVTPTSTASPTAGPSATATPTATPPPPVLATSKIGPMPAKRGSPVYVWFPQTPAGSEWTVYATDLQIVARLKFGAVNPQVFVGTNQLAAGLYFVKIRSWDSNGVETTDVKRLVVVP